MARDSFVTQQVRRIDGHLDRIQLANALWTPLSDDQISNYSPDAVAGNKQLSHLRFQRIERLQTLIKSLSTTSTPSAPLSSKSKILRVLNDAELSKTCPHCQAEISNRSVEAEEPEYEHELEWLLLAKAATQAYGAVLNTILDQTLQVNEHIWYWDDILSSHRWATVYSLQTSPLRLWNWSQVVWHRVKRRGGFQTYLSAGWSQFYVIVQEAVKDQSIAKMRSGVLSPLAQVQAEARRKQSYLRQLKDVSANALGVLLGEGLEFDNITEASVDEHAPPSPESKDDRRAKWKSFVAKSVALLEAVLVNVKDPEPDVDTFEDRISESTSEDLYFAFDKQIGIASERDLRPDEVGLRLQKVLRDVLPHNNAVFEQRLRQYGRPSPLIRYWLPATALVLSSSTILRVLVKRKADIITWVRELGQTTIDFWSNWVVEPTRKIIGTIRHDPGSEVALMSKRSLEGDRDSLERMVVDFAVQNPSTSGLSGNGTLSEAQIADIRAKVREGDLTPVLKAYEKDLQKPFVGALRGNLIRALLIQIQKTKVDIEVAMGGIDSILKSQELVFGVVSLTPGVLVTAAALRYVSSVFGSQRGKKDAQKQGQMVAVLRRIDRILTTAEPSKFGVLYYKDYGLLLTETHVLQQVAKVILPKSVYREFESDLEELCDVKSGPDRLRTVAERIRWGYGRYF